MPEAIGPYRILGKLGEGGMGIVYEAEQERPRREVALKVMRGGHVVDEVHAKMFQREAETLARLKHPNIGAIYEAGHHKDPATGSGHDYFAMELVRGHTLDHYLRKRGYPATGDELAFRLRLFRQICDAVHYAHQRGVIHRDLKPSNIIVSEQEASSSSESGVAGLPRVKILDFGLARITDTDVQVTQITEVGMIKGTLPYMSPEQARGQAEAIDVRTDVYALGVLLYEMLSGHKPYDAAKAALVEAVRVICEEPPVPLTRVMSESGRIDPDIETIVGKALEKEAERRYASAAAFSEDVGRYLDSQPILARPPSAAYQMRKFAARNRAGVTAAMLVLLAVLAGSVISFVQYVRAERAAERARTEAEKSSQVAAFMTEMLRSVGPSVALGRDTTMLREILERTDERVESELADQPEVAAIIHRTLGLTYQDLGEYAAAESHLKTALETHRALYDGPHPEVANDLCNLGEGYWSNTTSSDGEGLLRECLEMRLALVGERDPSVALARVQLGNEIARFGRYDEAEVELRAALELNRELPGVAQEDLAVNINSLGTVLHHKGQFDEAGELYREALEIHREVLGEDHPFTHIDRHNLAALANSRGDLEEAEAAYRELIEEQRRVLGERHATVAQTLSSLGSTLRRAGRYNEAEVAFREALEIVREASGERSADAADAINDLGIVIDYRDGPEAAEPYYRDALEIHREVLGDDNLVVASDLNNVAGVLVKRGEFEEAEELYRKALDIDERLLGPDHATVLLVRNNLARLLRDSKQLEAAEAAFREVIEARIRLLGEGHPQVAVSRSDLSRVLSEQGRIAEAEVEMRTALEAYSKAMGEEHPGTGIVKGGLAKLLIQLERYDEAVVLLRESVENLTKNYGAESSRAVRAREMLAEAEKKAG
jgi:tetratricopeptide (TPR) repeat protein